MIDAHRLHHLTGLVGDLEPGTVCLVGAGPGDGTLISVRGAVRLMQADVILHDKLIAPELLDLPTPEAQRVFVGKWRGEKSWTQERINTALVEHARAGRRVVRLKGGDPFVFGRGGEECQHLAAAGVPFEVVPGITAAFGAPATAGIPLTHRGLSRSFTLVTGHADPNEPERLDFAALARMETVALYMGVKNLAANCQGLMDAGMAAHTPAAVIHWGTRPEQRTVTGTLADIARQVAHEAIAPPAMILIGQVVRLRQELEWFERRPLHGQVVVVTRPRDQAAGLTGPLIAAGAQVVEAPTIEVADMEDPSAVDAALRQLSAYDWLVLTSSNGVDALFCRLSTLGFDARALAGVRIAVVGSATAARLQGRGIHPDLVPPEAVGESLAEAMMAQGVKGRRVLLLRADIAREQLVTDLKAGGALCDDVPAYRTVWPESLPADFMARWDAGGIDWITFTSPSSLVNLLALIGDERRGELRRFKLASIGPVTTRAIRQAGFEVSAEADPHDVSGLVAAIRAVVKGEADGRPDPCGRTGEP
jgi:uroporphyrinogen III methyltransferase/synthase